jgi:hypothetical protein
MNVLGICHLKLALCHAGRCAKRGFVGKPNDIPEQLLNLLLIAKPRAIASFEQVFACTEITTKVVGRSVVLKLNLDNHRVGIPSCQLSYSAIPTVRIPE